MQDLPEGGGESSFSKATDAIRKNVLLSGENTRPDNMARGSRNCPTTGYNSGKNRKCRKMYGLLERQFRKYFHEAERKKGITGEVLLQLIESRLDTMVFRMGFAPNRRRARQLIRHGHVIVNAREVNLPSFATKAGDLVEVREASRGMPEIAESLSKSEHRGIPGWVEIDSANYKGKVSHIPSRDEMQLPVQEQLIVELYSK